MGRQRILINSLDCASSEPRCCRKCGWKTLFDNLMLLYNAFCLDEWFQVSRVRICRISYGPVRAMIWPNLCRKLLIRAVLSHAVLLHALWHCAWTCPWKMQARTAQIHQEHANCQGQWPITQKWPTASETDSDKWQGPGRVHDCILHLRLTSESVPISAHDRPTWICETCSQYPVLASRSKYSMAKWKFTQLSCPSKCQRQQSALRVL